MSKPKRVRKKPKFFESCHAIGFCGSSCGKPYKHPGEHLCGTCGKSWQDKFSVGQVVRVKAFDSYTRILSGPDLNRHFRVTFTDAHSLFHESELRPLNAKEIGPRIEELKQ